MIKVSQQKKSSKTITPQKIDSVCSFSLVESQSSGLNI
jgi:hypothetical protein